MFLMQFKRTKAKKQTGCYRPVKNKPHKINDVQIKYVNCKSRADNNGNISFLLASLQKQNLTHEAHFISIISTCSVLSMPMQMAKRLWIVLNQSKCVA